MFKDVARLYGEKQHQVQVSLVESNQILSMFEPRLRAYAEKKFKHRKGFQLVHDSVTGMLEGF